MIIKFHLILRKLILIVTIVSSLNILSCSNDYIDPDGNNVFFYEECLHINRGKFTNELHQECAEYSKKQMIKHNMI